MKFVERLHPNGEVIVSVVRIAGLSVSDVCGICNSHQIITGRACN